MKKNITKAIILTLICAAAWLTTSCIFYPETGKTKKKPKPNPNPGNSIPQKEGMQLVWSDEFNYNGALDTTKWKYEYGGGGWGNGELQNYVGDGTTAFVSDGALTLKAYHNGSQWRSARINSKQSWTYGFMEASIKVTDKKGAWPAFWMMPKNSSYGIWPKSGEIDIMENAPAHNAFGPHCVFSTLHAQGHHGGGGKEIGRKTYPQDLFNDWHTFAVKWDADKIVAYYDGQIMDTYLKNGANWVDWPYDKDFYIILNLAIGGSLGGNAAAMELRGKDVRLLVDYVRVYQKS